MDDAGTWRHDVTGSVVGSRPEEVITSLGCTSFVGGVTAKFSAELDRVALYALQRASALSGSFRVPPLEIDPVLNSYDGVGVEVTDDGVVVISLEETGTNLRHEIRVLRRIFGRIATDTTVLAVSSSGCGERCIPCSTQSPERRHR